MGCEKGNPALLRGVQWISEMGPSASNIYYDYYATELMRALGGDPWEKWKPPMRKLVLDWQNKTEPHSGNWSVMTKFAKYGGSIYSTSMAIMILEACNDTGD